MRPGPGAQRPTPAQMRLAGMGSLPGGDPRCARACYATAAAGGAPGEPAGGNSMYNHPDCDWGGCYSSHDCPDAWARISPDGDGDGDGGHACRGLAAVQPGAVAVATVAAYSLYAAWAAVRPGSRRALQDERADRRRRSRRARSICARASPAAGAARVDGGAAGGVRDNVGDSEPNAANDARPERIARRDARVVALRHQAQPRTA